MIRCIAIDDEPLALRQISDYIRKTPFLDLSGMFESALSALEYLADNKVDLMFVDINMPDLSGIDFVKSLENPPMIVFITAYSEYAIDGFRVNALGYLLKPISYSDFLKTANKAKYIVDKLHLNEEKDVPENEYLFVKSDSKMVRISLKEINYIEGMREYVRIHLVDSKPLMPLLSLRALEEQLPSDKFMRVHRSYIVNLEKIISFDHSRISLDNKIIVPVSDQYKEVFLRFLNSHSLG